MADALVVNVQIDPIGAAGNGVGASVGQMLNEHNFIADPHFFGYVDEFNGHQIVIALRCFLETWRGIRQRRKQKNG